MIFHSAHAFNPRGQVPYKDAALNADFALEGSAHVMSSEVVAAYDTQLHQVIHTLQLSDGKSGKKD